MQYREECLPLPVAEWRKSQSWRNPAATRENNEKTSWSYVVNPARFRKSPREDSCLSHCHESSSGIFKPCEKIIRCSANSEWIWLLCALEKLRTQSSSLLAHAILKHQQMTLWRLNRPTEPSSVETRMQNYLTRLWSEIMSTSCFKVDGLDQSLLIPGRLEMNGRNGTWSFRAASDENTKKPPRIWDL